MLSQQIKNGTFYLGDCFEAMKEAPDNCVDMILCDLPYGTTACKWDTVLPFDKLWEQYWRIAKPNAVIVLTAIQPFTTALIHSQIDKFKYCWVWEKTRTSNPYLAKFQPLRVHEDIVIFSNSKHNYFPQMSEGQSYIVSAKSGGRVASDKKSNKEGFEQKTQSGRYPRSVLQISNSSAEAGLHPTQKPVALFEYLIKTYTNEGDLVMDNCAGSGTTAIACENTNRKWVCIEKDETYANAAIERIRNHAPKLD